LPDKNAPGQALPKATQRGIQTYHSHMTTFSAKHQTHLESLLRFLGLAALILAYFAYASWRFDAAVGAWLTVLNWSFFVLCTPVADGGFIIAFPIRLLFGARMLVTQVIVWCLAIAGNVVALVFYPDIYGDTALTRLLAKILTTPWPYWSILVISAAGTALSIWFGDEMLDVTTHAERTKHHRHGMKHRTLIIMGLAILAILAYYHLLSDLGIVVPQDS